MADHNSNDTVDLRTTPLSAFHRAQGGKMVPFAGYAMPVQYAAGVLTEHLWTRAHAGLFDVSHMGQIRLSGDGVAAALEALVPGDIQGLQPGEMRYTLLLNAAGGIDDDLMVTNMGDHYFLVVNASTKAADFARLKAEFGGRSALELLEDRALLALQGPRSVDVLSALHPEISAMKFMTGRTLDLGGVACFVTRSGYTGEDGFEISLPAEAAAGFVETLMQNPAVKPVGLGARDSLRLEAGLCLYGNDIDTETTPIEAALGWTIAKRRRAEANFPGAAKILAQLATPPKRKRVGIAPLGRAPARAGTAICDTEGRTIGKITSGGFGPSVTGRSDQPGGPIAMGYVELRASAVGTALRLDIRGTRHEAIVVALPFVPHRYHR